MKGGRATQGRLAIIYIEFFSLLRDDRFPKENHRKRKKNINAPKKMRENGFDTINDRAVSRSETSKNIRSKLRGIPHPAKAG
jgi:hypothetical protein